MKNIAILTGHLPKKPRTFYISGLALVCLCGLALVSFDPKTPVPSQAGVTAEQTTVPELASQAGVPAEQTTGSAPAAVFQNRAAYTPKNIDRLRGVLLTSLKHLDAAESTAATDAARAPLRAGIAELQRKLALLADVQFGNITPETAHARLQLWRAEAPPAPSVLRVRGVPEATEDTSGALLPQPPASPASASGEPPERVPLPDAPFYRTILENNLFAPLGTLSVSEPPIYRLIATLLSSEPGRGDRAILEDTRTQHTYTRRLGEKIGESTLVDIQSKQITVETAGEQTTLTLTPHLWLGK